MIINCDQHNCHGDESETKSKVIRSDAMITVKCAALGHYFSDHHRNGIETVSRHVKSEQASVASNEPIANITEEEKSRFLFLF